MALSKIPKKQLDDLVLTEDEDASDLGSGAATAGQVLTADGATNADWLTPSAVPNVEDLSSAGTLGQAFVADGASGVNLADVTDIISGTATSGQVLTANGAGATSWQDAEGNTFIRKVAGSGADFATDIGAALAAYETSSARYALILIGGAAVGATPVTVTKPVDFLGVVTGASIELAAASSITFDFPDASDEPLIRFENLTINKTPTNTSKFVINENGTLFFRNCTISNTGGDNTGLFRGNAVTSAITVFAEQCTFAAQDNAAVESPIFFSAATSGTGFFFKFNKCTYIIDAANPTNFADCTSANLELVLGDGTILHRPRIKTTTHTVVYDGTSVMTDDGNNTGTETVRGGARYNLDMDALANVDVEDVLEDFMGPSIFIDSGTYSYLTTITLGRASVSIRGNGGQTILIFEGTATDAISLTAAGIDISDLSVHTTALTSSEIISMNAAATGAKLRNIRVRALNTSPNIGIEIVASNVTVDNAQISFNAGGALSGRCIRTAATVTGTIIRNCIIDATGPATPIVTGIEATGDDEIIEDNKIFGDFLIGIRCDGTSSTLKGNYIDQTAVSAFTSGARGIDAAEMREGVITNNQIIAVAEFGISLNGTSGSDSARLRVTDNTIIGGRAATFGIVANGYTAENTIIANNHIFNPAVGPALIDTAILINGEGSPSVVGHIMTIRGNMINDMLDIGILANIGPIGANEFRGPTISDNDITFATAVGLKGISVDGDINAVPGKTTGLKITNNRIFLGTSTNPGNGIEVTDVTDADISGNHVEGRSTTGSSIGIKVDSVERSNINNNRVLGVETGIESVSPGSGDADNNMYATNHLQGNTTATTFDANETNRDEVFNKT